MVASFCVVVKAKLVDRLPWSVLKISGLLCRGDRLFEGGDTQASIVFDVSRPDLRLKQSMMFTR